MVIRNALFAAADLLSISIGQAATLTIDISNIKNNKGLVVITLHDGEDGFPAKREPIEKQFIEANEEGLVVSFANLAPGSYAIALFHDENGNRKMDQNFLGIPKEGLGTSNNAKGSFGPPSFKDSAVQIEDADVNIEISINY